MKSNITFYLRVTLSLLIISAVIAGLLGAVNAITKDRIAENKSKEMNKTIADIYGGEVVRNELPKHYDEAVNDAWVIVKEGSDIGYCVSVTTTGYGGDIVTLVALDLEGKVYGVRVMDNKETAGLGSRVTESWFLSRYTGKAENIADGEVDVITGSTVSSKAITEAVNIALGVYEEVHS